MTVTRRILRGLSAWLALLAVLGYFTFTSEHRVKGLLITLPLGAFTYLSGEWFRARRAQSRGHAIVESP